MIPGDEIEPDGWGRHFKATCFFAIHTVMRWANEHGGAVPTVDQMVTDLSFTPEFGRRFTLYAYEKGWIVDE